MAQDTGSEGEPIELDTLSVVGSRTTADLPLRTRAVEVLDRATLDRLPARNLTQALEWGVSLDLASRSPAQADLSIRGAGFEQMLVLVDGVRMSDPQTGHFDLDLAVPLDRVERIEILRGPGAGIYGSDAVGGVVNIVTRESSAWAGRLEGGSFGSVLGALHGGVDLPARGSLQFSGEVARSDGHREGTEWESSIGTASLRYPLAEGTLRLESGLARRAFGAEGFYAPFPSFETTDTWTAHLTWRSNPSRQISLEPGLSWRSHGDDFILDRHEPEAYRNRHTSEQVGASLVARGAIRQTVSLAAGSEVARHDLRSTALGDRTEARGAVFAEIGWRPTLGPALMAGLRHDHYEQWGGFTSPSLSLGMDVSERLELRASAGRAFRGPSWTERHYRDPVHEANAELDPEESTSLEFGGTLHSASGRGQLSLTGFRRASRHLIDWARPIDSPEALWVTRNVNRSVTRGLEAEGAWMPGRRTRVELAASWLALEADADDRFQSKQLLRPIRDRVRISLIQALPGNLQGAFHLARSRRAGDLSYEELDLRIQLPSRVGMWYLDGRNLTNSRHLDITGNPVAGRAVYLGLELRGR